METNRMTAIAMEASKPVAFDTGGPSFRRIGDVVAIQSVSGRTYGFHARNLEAAELDALAWRAFVDSGPQSLEALQEIRSWDQAIDLDVQNSSPSMKVQSLNINISQICNLHCSYCAAGGDGTYGNALKNINLDQTYEQLKMLIGNLNSGDAFHITFLGGEPLIYPAAIEAISRFMTLQTAGRNIDISYGIVTNGTLITDEIAELLAKIRCNVTISIDGPPHINDRARPTRGGLGSTERTLRGLSKLLKVKSRLGQLASASVFGKHYADVVETWNFLRQFDFDRIKFDFAAEADDAVASDIYIKNLNQCADLAFALGGETELRRIHTFDTYFGILDSRVRITDHCGAGKSHLQLDASGRFSPCQWFVGSPEEHLGQGVSLDDSSREAYRASLVDTNNCGQCWARYVCGGGCMFVNKIKTKSKFSKDGEFCKRMRNTLAKGIEYYVQSRQPNKEEICETH